MLLVMKNKGTHQRAYCARKMAQNIHKSINDGSEKDRMQEKVANKLT